MSKWIYLLFTNNLTITIHFFGSLFSEKVVIKRLTKQIKLIFILLGSGGAAIAPPTVLLEEPPINPGKF